MNPDDIPDYRDHLIKSFSCISSHPIIRTNCPHITFYSGKIRDALKDFRDPTTWKLSVDPPWAIPILDDGRHFSKDEASLLLSGILTVEDSVFGMYTFVSSILFKSVNNQAVTQIPLEEYAEHRHIYKDRLVRRFHFDLATGNNDTNKPLSHVQFGGNDRGCTQYTYALSPRIGIPRIPYPPIDFIILFDMMLRQFKTKIHSGFYDSKEWINCVKKSEEMRIKEYYDLIEKYFNNDNHRKTLSSLYCEDTFFV